VHSTRKEVQRDVQINGVTSPLVTVQDIVSPHRKNNEHTLDNLRGRCLMIIPVFFTATAYWSWTSWGSLTHTIQGSLKCNNPFRTPPCCIDLSHGWIPELHVQTTPPFCQHVKIFLAHSYNYEFFFTRNLSYKIFLSQIFSNLRYLAFCWVPHVDGTVNVASMVRLSIRQYTWHLLWAVVHSPVNVSAVYHHGDVLINDREGEEHVVRGWPAGQGLLQ